MVSASHMLHGKSASLGLERLASSTVTIEGDNIEVAYGYPIAQNSESWALLLETTTSDAIWGNENTDWYFSNSADDGTIIYAPESRRLESDNCYIEYTEATSTALPSFISTNTGC